jgi:hypothetical protein
MEKLPDETYPEHMGRVLGEAAPSMFVSTASQTTAFFLGALSDMPAVRAFALYAAASLLINFFMQVSILITYNEQLLCFKFVLFVKKIGRKTTHKISPPIQFKVYLHNLLNNEHLSTTATILWSQG